MIQKFKTQLWLSRTKKYYKFLLEWLKEDGQLDDCMESHEFLKKKHFNYCNDCGRKL